MFFRWNMVRSHHSVISSYMVPLLVISGHYDVIKKNFKKILILWFSVFERVFRTKNVLIIISSENATKWCVTWPYFAYDLENAQFDHSFRNFIRTSGSKICWSPNEYFSNQWKKCFNLTYYLDHLSLIPFFHIMTVRDVKIFLAVSRDSSIDNQNENKKPLSNSTLSDFIKNWWLSTNTSGVVLRGKFWLTGNFLTFW